MGNAILDMNTRIHRYLGDYHGAPATDLTTSMSRHLREHMTQSEYTARFLGCMDEATE